MADKNKIDKIQQRIEELKKQLRQEKAKENARERKIDTRKKILYGAMLMHWVEIGEISEADLLKGLDKFLTRDSDRSLFDLSSISDSKVSTSAKKKTQTANHSSKDTASKVSDKSKIQKSTTSNKESRRSRLNAGTSSEDIEKEFNL